MTHILSIWVGTTVVCTALVKVGKTLCRSGWAGVSPSSLPHGKRTTPFHDLIELLSCSHFSVELQDAICHEVGGFDVPEVLEVGCSI